ncbi:MAG: hypothetical protein JWN48_4433 [Myxococcaceae bacterium]|nr:hypothetical protein [Myxococcaceae bacterium]
MATQKDGGLVSRAVREALGTLVSPQVYGQLLTRSLQASGLSEIPESGRALAQWIEGALNREIESVVGADAAELVAAQLAPIVAHAAALARPAAPTPTGPPQTAPSARNEGSNAQPRRDAFGSEQPTGLAAAPKPAARRADLVRTARLKFTREQLKELHSSEAPRDIDAGHTSRPQAPDSPGPAQAELTRVLTASSSASAIAALRSYLSGTTEVVAVADLVGLLDALESRALVEPVVVLDCQRPTLHVSSVSAIGEDLPSGTTIVLWGGSDELWNQIDRERTASCRWVRCSHEATTDDVGSLCAMLIGAVRR